MTNEANDTNVVETETTEAPEAPTEKLSRRDALEVAIAAARDDSAPKDPSERVLIRTEDAPAKVETKPDAPKFKAPAEFTKEEQADFNALNPKQQEASLRLHHSRLKTIEGIKRERSELERERSEAQTYRDMAKNAEPFIKALGLKDASPVLINKALKMWAEFEMTDNPEGAAAAYLRAKGKAVPKDLIGDPSSQIHPEIKTLKDEISALRSEREDEKRSTHAHGLLSEFHSFVSSKNAGGSPKFPSLQGSDETVQKLAADIGSLVRGDSEYSNQFIAKTAARIPNLTMQGLLFEAYKYCGGSVDEAAATKTQDTQAHINRAKRASASQPGRANGVAVNGAKKLSRRDALALAIELHNNPD